jgi:hypothetical protein
MLNGFFLSYNIYLKRKTAGKWSACLVEKFPLASKICAVGDTGK